MNMRFEKSLSILFLEFVNEIIYLKFYLDGMIKSIKEKSEDDKAGIFKSFLESIFNDQKSLLSKIVHIYSITIFETFNKEFFKEINDHYNLIQSNFSITPSKIISFCKTNFNIDINNEFSKWNDLKENICRRHVIAHNMGKIDIKYIDCVDIDKSLEGKVIGKEVKHDLEYVKKCNNNVCSYMVFLFKKISDYYSLKDIEKIVYNLAEEIFQDVNPNILKDVKT